MREQICVHRHLEGEITKSCSKSRRRECEEEVESGGSCDRTWDCSFVESSASALRFQQAMMRIKSHGRRGCLPGRVDEICRVEGLGRILTRASFACPLEMVVGGRQSLLTSGKFASNDEPESALLD